MSPQAIDVERLEPGARPVRVREIRHAAGLLDEAHAVGEALERHERLGYAVDAVGQEMTVAPSGKAGVELDARHHDEAASLVLRDLGADPVVGRRQHVIAGRRVVRRERPGRQLAVGVRGVGVQGRAEPAARRAEWIDRIGHSAASSTRALAGAKRALTRCPTAKSTA